MSWRPKEGWDAHAIAAKVLETYPLCHSPYPSERAMVEAGADAGIKAVVEWGEEDYPLNFGQFPLVPAGWSGWLTTIPDEEEGADPLRPEEGWKPYPKRYGESVFEEEKG